MTNEMLFRFEKSQPHNIARPIPQVLKGAENANRATIISCSKPRRNAAVNMGTTVFARLGLRGASCGCPAGQVGTIMRFEQIASALGFRPSRSRDGARLHFGTPLR